MDKFVEASFNVLNKDEIYSILKLLKPLEVLKFCQIEKYARYICNDTDLFRTLMHEHFPTYKLNKVDPKEQYFNLANRLVSVYQAKIEYQSETGELLSPEFEVSDVDDTIYGYILLEIDGRVRSQLEGYVAITLNENLDEENRKDGYARFFADFESAVGEAFRNYMYDVSLPIKDAWESREETLENMNLDPNTWDNKTIFRENILATNQGAYYEDDGQSNAYYVFKVVLPPNKGIRLDQE